MDYPLINCRVVDFGWVAAGPVLGRILADMGAEVIKVESRKRVDTSRYSPDNIENDPEKDSWFHCMNRNKMGITVDMTSADGQALLRRLIKISDVVIENFYPGIMKRFGLDYETLREESPRLIMVSLPGLGSWGPEAATPSYASSLSALSGLDSMVGYVGERAQGIHSAVSDVNTGMLGAFAVLVALWQRDQTGEGQFVELPQLEGLVSCMGEGIMEFVMNGRSLGPDTNRSRVFGPHGNYRCRGDDKWVSIAVKAEEEWHSLCQVMGRPELVSDERFADRYNRVKNYAALDEVVGAWTIQHGHYEAMAILQQAGIAGVACLDVDERFSDPHFNARETFAFYPHPATGNTLMPNPCWKMSETRCPVYRHAPLMGQHNQYVCQELLGLSEAEFASLQERQILY